MKKISVISNSDAALMNMRQIFTALTKFGYEVLVSHDGKDALQNTSLVVIDECGQIGGQFRDFFKKYQVAPCIIVGCNECKEKEFVWGSQNRSILAKAL